MKGYALLPGPLLARRTTMGLGGEALAEIRVTDAWATEDALDRAESLALERGGRVVFLGRGSNLLVREGELPLVVVSLALDTLFPLREEGERVILRAGANAPLAGLLDHAASLGLSGLEGLTGIPGSLGGALVMNAGSFGVSMAEVVCGAGIWTRERGLWRAEKADLAFAYRLCRLARGGAEFLAVEVALELSRDEPARVKERMAAIFKRKRAEQPITARSAGCVFRNPHPEHPAGRLLEEAGLRGRRHGAMRFSPVHANFLINEGQGTFVQARELISMAREAVKRRSGFDLELEAKIWA
ncbi:MAG: UDP-N-acetylmuramate dehydrogenase [Desulfovibrio sp.]|jgi:UDP-N-acetylmuramate dehydrogenase|nr:UDP-N-acetylmuramate dehydrogenase [Desulfovibrio sp.]